MDERSPGSDPPPTELISNRKPAPGDEPQPSGLLGKYRILRALGRGGMGMVHEALDVELDRRVALKLMLPFKDLSPEDVRLEEERFVREARLAAHLPRHANIVTLYEAGVIEGRRYLAMELIEGKPLSAWVKDDRPAQRQQLAALRDVALAVHHAHEHGVLHRDLKPGNVLIDAKGRPYVTDFGLAKKVDGPPGASLTGSGAVVGTPAYMSPEQAGGRGVDRRSDVYALGVMLYEILTGRPPFAGDSAIEIMVKVIRDPVPPPSQTFKEGGARPDRALETICLKALEKNPDLRYVSARDFANDLTRWLLGQKVTVRSVRPEKKMQAWMYVAAVAAVGAVAALVFKSAGRKPPSPSPPPAVATAPSPPPPEPPPPLPVPQAAFRVLTGHTQRVWSVAFAPRGGLLASGGDDGAIRLWDAAAGTGRATLGGAFSPVRALAFSPDGTSLAAGYNDRHVRVWEAASGKERWAKAGHSGLVQAVAFAPDGGTIVSAGRDAKLKAWDAAAGAELREMSGHALRVVALAIDPAGELAASGSEDRTIRLWDLGAGRERRRIAGAGILEALAFSPDGRLLAAGYHDSTLRLWSPADGAEVRVLRGHTDNVWAVAFSPDGKLLATGSKDGSIRLWDPATGESRRTVPAHAGGVRTLAFSPDGATLASGGEDATLRLWNAAVLLKR